MTLSVTDTHRTGMASSQLQGFIRNDQLPPDSTESWSTLSGARCWRPITGSIQNPNQSPNSKKRYRWSGIACHRNRSTRLLKASHWLKRRTKADVEQFEHTKWLSHIRQSVHCVVSVTLFCCVSAQMYFSAWKSLGVDARISITLSYLKLIKCRLAVKRR